MLAPTLSVPIWSAVTVIVVTILAADSDARTRRIPNRLTGPALLLALATHGVLRGPSGLLEAGLGAVVAGGLLLPGWLMGWMGAGDVKLMAAVGAWLAYPASLAAVLFSLIAGGVMAIVVAVRHRSLGKALRGAALMGAWATVAGGRGMAAPPTSGLRFPFAAAILAGSLAALWIRL